MLFRSISGSIYGASNIAVSNNMSAGGNLYVSGNVSMYGTIFHGGKTIINGQQISITIGIKNQGSVGSGQFYVAAYLSIDSTITTGDVYLGSVFVNNLGAGVQQTVEREIGGVRDQVIRVLHL